MIKLNVGHYYFDNKHLMSVSPKLTDKLRICNELKNKINDWHRQNNYSPPNNWTVPDFVDNTLLLEI